MADAFKSGDLVKLKSGGPTMTVLEKLDNDLYRCMWFVAGDCRKENFPPEALVKA